MSRKGSAAGAPAKEVQEMTTTIEMKVKGMTCTGCEERIQGAIGELEGVEAVAADHHAGTVSVALEPENTATDEVRAAIDGLGYRTVTE